MELIMNILTILAVALGTIALFAVVFQILYLIKYRGMHYNWITFRRKGYALGLEKKEIKMLRDIAFDNRLADFDTIYTTIRLLDRSIIKSVHILKEKELSEAYKHKRIENIFLLRNKMDYIFAAQKKTISATNELKINQKIALTFERIGT